MFPIFARANPNALFHRESSVSNLSRSNTSVASSTRSGSGSESGSYLRFPPTRMSVIAGGLTEAAVSLPLRLSLALRLPLRLAEVNDNVPCFKPPEPLERGAFVELDLCGAMLVVVEMQLTQR